MLTPFPSPTTPNTLLSGDAPQVDSATAALRARQLLRRYALQRLAAAAGRAGLDTPDGGRGSGGGVGGGGDVGRGRGGGDEVLEGGDVAAGGGPNAAEAAEILDRWRAAEGIAPLLRDGAERPHPCPRASPPPSVAAPAPATTAADGPQGSDLGGGKTARLRLTGLGHGFDGGEWLLRLRVRNVGRAPCLVGCAAMGHMQARGRPSHGRSPTPE